MIEISVKDIFQIVSFTCIISLGIMFVLSFNYDKPQTECGYFETGNEYLIQDFELEKGFWGTSCIVTTDDQNKIIFSGSICYNLATNKKIIEKYNVCDDISTGYIYEVEK